MKELILLYLSRLPAGMPMTERVLRTELSQRLRDMPGEGDLTFALDEMQRDGWIACSKSVLNGDRLWQITDAGRGALAQG